MLCSTRPCHPSSIGHSRQNVMWPWVCRNPSHCSNVKHLHISEGIKKSKKEDWIRIDCNYLDRMIYRKQLVDNFQKVCLGASKASYPAIRELYEEIILDLLPKRFPTIFRIKGDVFYNLVTGSHHIISTALTDYTAMLQHLATNVEEDFWLMVPNERNEFILLGFVACFPQGLLPSAKVGMSVSEIHEPVPGYDGRLKKGVVRCFERMERGSSVARLNVRLPPSTRDIALLIYHSGPFNVTPQPYTSPTTAPTPSKTPPARPKTQTSTPNPPSSVSNITR